jgi:hypothetical protein
MCIKPHVLLEKYLKFMVSTYSVDKAARSSMLSSEVRLKNRQSLLSFYRAWSLHFTLSVTGVDVLCPAVNRLLPIENFEVHRITWEVFSLSELS